MKCTKEYSLVITISFLSVLYPAFVMIPGTTDDALASYSMFVLANLARSQEITLTGFITSICLGMPILN